MHDSQTRTIAALPEGERIRRPRVAAEITGQSISSLYRRLAENSDFPRPVRIGPNAVGFLDSELQGWIARRRQERDAA